MANPAAVHCATLGYENRIVQTKDGQSGTCVFTDGTHCDDWAFYHGSCGQQFSACIQAGGTLENKNESQSGSTSEYGLCTFRDGTQCSEDALTKGECKSGECFSWSVQNGCVKSTKAQPSTTGLANPASLFCRQQSYTLTAEGECIFPDGTSCEQWAFYRGTCGKQHTDCEKRGGKIDARTETVNGNTGSYAVCVFADGSECAESQYSSGYCKAGECASWTTQNGCTAQK